MQSFSAVLFDLDDTLVVEEAMAAESFEAVCRLAQSKVGTDPAALHRAVRRRARELWHSGPAAAFCQSIGISSWEGLWGRFTAHPDLGAWAPTYQFQSWKQALAELGVSDDALASELAAAFHAERRRRHRTFPDAEPALRELRGRCALGLITNGASDLQREKIRGAGLDGYFDLVVASGDLGVGKPEPSIFTHALRQLGVPPHEAVMVGDSLQRDVVGAQNVGIRGVWLNRRDHPRESGLEPDSEVRSLSEFLGLLVSL